MKKLTTLLATLLPITVFAFTAVDESSKEHYNIPEKQLAPMAQITLQTLDKSYPVTIIRMTLADDDRFRLVVTGEGVGLKELVILEKVKVKN